MVRIIKNLLYDATKSWMAAQRLLYLKGYEQMTIQDILDDTPSFPGGVFYTILIRSRLCWKV